MQWTELTINTTDEAVDWVYMLLLDAGYAGDIYITPYTAGNKCFPWTFTIHLYLVNDIQINQSIDKIAQQLTPLQRTKMADELEIGEVESNSKNNTNLFHKKIGDRFLIIPAHEANFTLPPDNITIKLKPSLAFGSGLHPATILSLQLLEKYVTSGMYTLDLGSGSGILSIAIAKQGASVLALDNDANAVKSTEEAVSLNGVDSQVTIAEGSLGQGSTLGHWMGGKTASKIQAIETQQKFDLIVANIFARIHIALARDYQQALGNNGILLASGFTEDYAASIISAMEEQGFTLIDREQLHEWISLAFQS
ncbi:MAG: 50S ribosomal protein L11 methyltransferase [Richelia sp.]|nr:50S ribosomal protein L11 methyltransferase [Richelia sp.]CDN10881.1 Ribosomal protein L11 methyltransferase [Richelia intracellularis]